MKVQRILVVDDNRDLADGLAVVLEEENHQVMVAYSGENAITQFEQEDFDLVFVDLKLPGISGMDVFRQLHKKSPATPIIIMTGFRIDQLLMQVADKEPVRILRKPFVMEMMLKSLQEIQSGGVMMIVDEFSESVTEVEQFLHSHGHRPLVVGDSHAAIAGMTAESYDTLVLDLKQPILNVLDTYLELKEQGHKIPTIIITGRSPESGESADALHSMAVTGCFFKPFEPEGLLQSIQNLP